jgi:hypothetical protein
MVCAHSEITKSYFAELASRFCLSDMEMNSFSHREALILLPWSLLSGDR